MRPALPLLLLALTLPACASKETRVRTALTDAGIAPTTAACMARPMAEQLSVDQLRSLGSVAGVRGSALRDLPLTEAIARLSRVLDAQTLAVVTRAGLGCALRG